MTDRSVPSDDELMKSTGDGDVEAFEKLYHRHKSLLANFFRRQGGQSAVLDDLLQEVFLRVWRNAPRYESRGRFVPYLFTIARSVYLDELRRHPPAQRVAAPEEFEEQWERHVPAVADAQPDAQLERRELRERLQQALNCLSTEHRMTVILSELAGLSYHEIAKIMNCPPGTVSSRKCVAMSKLRRILDKTQENKEEQRK